MLPQQAFVHPLQHSWVGSETKATVLILFLMCELKFDHQNLVKKIPHLTHCFLKNNKLNEELRLYDV